jgi:urease accessory protein UreH
MALSHFTSPAGAARLVFAHRGTTRLARLFQKAPLRVLMPRPAPGEPPCAVLLNTSGGSWAATRDCWEVRIGRRLARADALRLAPEPGALLDATFGFAGAGSFATCIFVAPDAVDRVRLARDLATWSDVRSGATCIGPVLVVRWLAADPAAVRQALQQFCARFRHAVAGWPERVPATW